MDAALLVVALVASAISVVRERLTTDAEMPGGMVMSSMTPLGVAHLAIAAKVVLAAAVLAFVLLRVHRRGCADLIDRLASSPLLRTAVLVGAAIAVGLAVFDVCTSYHGAGMDASGSCQCWLTAALAGCGAFVAGVAIAAGRAIVAFARRIIRAVVALVIRFLPEGNGVGTVRRRVPPLRAYRAPGLARHVAGRAPPREA